MRLFKGISAIAFSIFALASFNAKAETVVIASGTCYSYGCSTPSQSCSSQGGTFMVNSANGQYTCTKTYPDTPTTPTTPTTPAGVVIASGTCYSYGCSTPAQSCASQGGTFAVNSANGQYTCTTTATPPTTPPPATWVVIASGTCYSYGCATPSQYCSSQGGAFSVNGSNQYTCKKLM